MPDIQNPHDKFFKEAFARPEVVRDFLSRRLPPDVLAQVDLNTLQLQKDSFVDPALQEHFTDLLFQVNIHNHKLGFIYLLFEHKSYPDRWLAFQLLRYMMRIWEQAHRDQPDENLPIIIPLVIYQGRVKWTIASDFAFLFAGPESLKRYWPNFTFELTDLSRYNETDIKEELLLRVVLFTMRLINNKKLVPQLPEMFALIMRVMPRQTALEFLDTVLRYMAYASDSVSREDIRQALRKALPDKGDVIMGTLVREWLEEGRAKGLEEGRQEGRQEGLQEGLLQAQKRAVLAVLRTRFGEGGEDFAAALQPINDLDYLQQLLRQAVLVPSLGEFRVN
ncbi:MAG: Rpn family recombination-promoting nuclease/putative transposase [Candidatus Promineifilaceae bacterium]